MEGIAFRDRVDKYIEEIRCIIRWIIMIRSLISKEIYIFIIQTEGESAIKMFIALFYK